MWNHSDLLLSSFIFSGDVFVGRRGKDKNGHGMNMYGHFIVKAVFLQLIEDYRINKPSTKVRNISAF